MIVIWSVLVVIGVFDAREYRIPNYLLLILLAYSFFNIYSSSSYDLELFIPHILGFIVAFSVSLVFYVLKIMAAGDVKLFGVVGFIFGFKELFSISLFIAFSCCFIGFMYWSLNHLTNKKCSSRVMFFSKAGFNFCNYVPIYIEQIKEDFKLKQNLTYMPFAPVLIIALAMYQYFKH
ncbi:A24 family peptidase [Vibrio sp. C8]